MKEKEDNLEHNISTETNKSSSGKGAEVVK